jgi:hypothetical protein
MLVHMRTLDELSGRWRGLSTQESERITETIFFRFNAGQIFGEGTDRDGDFRMVGSYDSQGNIFMVRIYHVCTYGPEHTGIPYEYRGNWDGDLIAGSWHVAHYPEEGGPFEMWPEREEDLEKLQINLRDLELVYN